jgi:hypothetical protein
MKHVTYAEKSLLVGDEAADTLMEYAALVVSRGMADTVDLAAFGSDGQEVTATLLIDQGAPLMCETSNTSMQEPNNDKALEYMRGQILLLTSPRLVAPVEDTLMLPQHDDMDIPDSFTV